MHPHRNSLEDISERLHQIDEMIQKRDTGTPKDLGKKLDLSLRTVYWYLAFMRKLGAPILYDYKKRTYYYSQSGTFVMAFLPDTAVLKERLKKIDDNVSSPEWSW